MKRFKILSLVFVSIFTMSFSYSYAQERAEVNSTAFVTPNAIPIAIEETGREMATELVKITPKKILSAFQHLYTAHAKVEALKIEHIKTADRIFDLLDSAEKLADTRAEQELFKSLKDHREFIAKKIGEVKATAWVKYGAGLVIDAAVDVMANELKQMGVFSPTGALGQYKIDEYVFKLWCKTVKNEVTLNIPGEILDAGFLIYDSWKETIDMVESLPEDIIERDPTLSAIHGIMKSWRMVKDSMRRAIQEAYKVYKPLHERWAITSSNDLLVGMGFRLGIPQTGAMFVARGGHLGVPASDLSKFQDQQASMLVRTQLSPVDTIAPYLVSVNPANGATNVPLTPTSISWTFNEAMSSGYSVYITGSPLTTKEFSERGGSTPTWISEKIFTITYPEGYWGSGSTITWILNHPDYPPTYYDSFPGGVFADKAGNILPTTSGSFTAAP